VKGVPLSLRGVGVEVVPKPKVIPVYMPSFLFVELSCYHLRNLKHRRKVRPGKNGNRDRPVALGVYGIGAIVAGGEL